MVPALVTRMERAVMLTAPVIVRVEETMTVS
jgi:hypothetical protein